jgi:hypothetical protein
MAYFGLETSIFFLSNHKQKNRTPGCPQYPLESRGVLFVVSAISAQGGKRRILFKKTS